MSEVLREWKREHLVNGPLLELLSALFVPEARRLSIGDIRQCAWLKEQQVVATKRCSDLEPVDLLQI